MKNTKYYYMIMRRRSVSIKGNAKVGISVLYSITTDLDTAIMTAKSIKHDMRVYELDADYLEASQIKEFDKLMNKDNYPFGKKKQVFRFVKMTSRRDPILDTAHYNYGSYIGNQTHVIVGENTDQGNISTNYVSRSEIKEAVAARRSGDYGLNTDYIVTEDDGAYDSYDANDYGEYSYDAYEANNTDGESSFDPYY